MVQCLAIPCLGEMRLSGRGIRGAYMPLYGKMEEDSGFLLFDFRSAVELANDGFDCFHDLLDLDLPVGLGD